MRIITKKRVIILIVIIIVICIGYAGLHLYGNHKIVSQYAKGYEKNAFDDYYMNKGEYTFSVLPISMFDMTTNLSLANSKGNVDLVIWLNIFGNVGDMGLVINTGNSMEQIYINRDFTAVDKEDNQMLKKYTTDIKKLKQLANEEWGI